MMETIRDGDRVERPHHLFLQEIPPEARSAAFDSLFFNLRQGWQLPFWLMLSLSVCIASLGLSQNSAATVIGAMIVAPLGQPIIAFGASVTLGWPRQTIRMLALIAIGALTVIVIAYLFGVLLPEATPSDQVLARTAPDLRDLGVALCAGAAGAYGYYRSEYSTVLAGVAIAVALVPPLCTVGLMLEEGRLILATGGGFLFLANFVGVALAAIFTFFLLGTARSGARRRWFLGGTAATGLVCLAIFAPLALNYDRFAAGVRFQKQVYTEAANALRGASHNPVIAGLTIDGAEATIRLRPLPQDVAEQQRLTQALQRATGLQISLAAAEAAD